MQNLLQSRGAEIIQLYRKTGYQSTADSSREIKHQSRRVPRRRYLLLGFSGAAAILIALTGSIAWHMYGPRTYTTAIGEQRIFNLDDGSVIVLNTDSRMKIHFSKRERAITLLQGEALFTAEHDAHRPFIVSAGTAAVRAIGTEFNVRRHSQETDVSVVEGVVQVNTRQLAAGEEAQVHAGQVDKRANPNVANTLSWRARRLVFTNASFADVAAEFNRYNRAQVHIEGEAKDKRLTGIFDADHPRAFVLYAMRDESLSVRTDGGDWIIREHRPDEP